MKDHEIDRAAILMIEKYGDAAVQRAIQAVEYHLSHQRQEDANRWIKIGYCVKNKLDTKRKNLSSRKEAS